MIIDPILKEKIRLGEARVSSVFDGSIEPVRQLICQEFGQLGLACYFLDWKNLPPDIRKYFGRGVQRYRDPLAVFRPGSINVVYNCAFPDISRSGTDKTSLETASDLGEFVSYFEGGSGRMTIDEYRKYMEHGVHVLLIFPAREDWVNYLRFFHTGREHAIDSENLLVD